MIFIVMGVSGSGKTTVGQRLAARLGCGFSDADDFHSAANKAKMAAGIPLSDDDRAPWLQALRAAIDGWERASTDHVLACSALKARYRDALGAASPSRRFVYLKGSLELFKSRLENRSGHFFNPALLQSQFEALEEPADAIVVDAAQSVDAQVEQILAAVAH
jgi:gluconokinase